MFRVPGISLADLPFKSKHSEENIISIFILMFSFPYFLKILFMNQKGATPQEVKALDQGLRSIASLFEKQGGRVNDLPGGGAAGGAGAGVACFLNGRVASGIDVLLDLVKFDELVKSADLIVTGEGAVDGQTIGGKAVQGIARRAAGCPVVVLSGSADLDREAFAKLQASGVTAVFPIAQGPATLAEAMAKASDNLRSTAMNVFSLIKAQAARR